MTTSAAAEYLELKPDTVREYIKRGLIASEKLGRDYVITKKACDEFKKTKRSRGNPNFRSKKTRKAG